MNYKRIIELPKDRAEAIRKFENITGEEAYNKYGLKEDEVIFESYVFETGYEVEIKLVIPSWESYTWTEAILYDKNNNQVVCTEPSDLFFGEWILVDEKNNDTYTVIVK